MNIQILGTKKPLLLMLLIGLLLSGCNSSEQPLIEDDNISKEDDASETDLTENLSETDDVVDVEGEEVEHKAEYINGRGKSDSGRNEPDYINVIGYVVVSSSEEYSLRSTDEFNSQDLWIIPTYEKDKQFWNLIPEFIPHKTEVVVREQFLEHEGYGAYSGYLLVEEIHNGEQHYIDVSNFITKPYWEYSSDLRDAASIGCYVAEYHQVSDYYPMFNDGSQATIDDGKIVLVIGTSNLSTPYPDWSGVEAVVWDDWRFGYGDVTVHFNSKDLTLVY